MDNEDMTYEKAYERLSAILDELENGGLKLSDVFSKFKEAMSLYEYCKSTLDKVEGEVKVLLKENDRISEVDFNDEYKGNDYA
ncbi:MAG TPA: exodeoxyribonuclease VII small subunit [Soehngenia sp.]|nr:exodeoxyribonuclease VII small subunit [Soehngenia sp.]